MQQGFGLRLRVTQLVRHPSALTSFPGGQEGLALTPGGGATVGA